MRTHYRLTMLVLIAAMFIANDGRCAAQGQGQPGGGSLPGDAMGGAALVFRKPANPALHTGGGSSPGSAGGGRLSGSAKTRAAKAAAHERASRRISFGDHALMRRCLGSSNFGTA